MRRKCLDYGNGFAIEKSALKENIYFKDVFSFSPRYVYSGIYS